jgi:peptidoglycan hydrolase CwlO-like protein
MIRLPSGKTFIAVTVICTAIASGCMRPAENTNHSSSDLNDIATDLPDSGGDLPVHLYWVTDTKIFRGYCANQDSFLRTHCRDNMVSMRWEDFKQQLDGGLSTTIRALQQEIRNIQAAITSIESQIAQVLAEINRIEQQQGGISRELQQLRAEMQDFQVIVQGYREQLRLIDESLALAVDRDMAELRLYVMNQLRKYQQSVDDISVRIEQLMLQIRGAQAQLADLRDQANRLNNRLQNLNADLSIVQRRLESAYSDFNVYAETLRKLTSGIVHPILADNDLWRNAERQFVKRFDTIFNTRP